MVVLPYTVTSNSLEWQILLLGTLMIYMDHLVYVREYCYEYCTIYLISYHFENMAGVSCFTILNVVFVMVSLLGTLLNMGYLYSTITNIYGVYMVP